MESKGEYTAVARAPTRRRAYRIATPYRSLSTRLNRLTKLNKMQNPLHCYTAQLNVAPTTITTTTAPINVCDPIIEGDAYNQRFGTHIYVKRIRISAYILSTATTPMGAVRLVIFRSQAGTTLAGSVVDTNTSSAVIANNNISRVFFDRTYPISPIGAEANPIVKVDLKINSPVRFVSGANIATTGDVIFVSWVGTQAAGATAPAIGGWMETWFSP